MPETQEADARREAQLLTVQRELDDARAENVRLKVKLDKADRTMTVLANRLYILHSAGHGGPFADCPHPICKDARAAVAAYREA